MALWMRGSVSFVALRELLVYIAQHPEGVRPKEMETWAREKAQLRTRSGKVISKTTVYHYRNTLRHLGILAVVNGRYQVAREKPFVQDLLGAFQPGAPALTLREKESFAQFVVQNRDCRHYFFDLFMPSATTDYKLNTFLVEAQPVVWRRLESGGNRFEELYNIQQTNKRRRISSEDERQALLYGVRYWARNELGFIEEIFIEGTGGLMFPVYTGGRIPDPHILKALLSSISPDEEWTYFSLRKTATEWGPKFRVSLNRLYGTLRWVYQQAPQYVVFIPTSESFATITASSPQTETYQLRGYFQDMNGRYISHMRVHRKLKEVLSCPEISHA
ncbi:hypothetical protein [Thiolapillus sp.]